MAPTPVDLTDSRNFVSGVPYEWFAICAAMLRRTGTRRTTGRGSGP